jgi:inorganic pyrophosphatase
MAKKIERQHPARRNPSNAPGVVQSSDGSLIINTNAFSKMSPFDGEHLNVVIETPRGSRNKYKYEPQLGIFRLNAVLPAGAVFPFDFGFIPGTRSQDGDPLDVLMLLDEPTFAGCLVGARLVGALKAKQQKGKSDIRNDRLIAVSARSKLHEAVHELSDLGERLMTEIEHFFVSYNAAKERRFKPIGRCDARSARELVLEYAIAEDHAA